jgi:hypothetical protein
MLSIFFLFIKGKVMNNPLVSGALALGAIVLFMFVIANFSTIEKKLGIETKASLKEKTIQQSATINNLGDANKGLSKSLDEQTKSTQVTVDTVIEKGSKDNKANDSFSVINDKRNTDIGIALKTPDVPSSGLIGTKAYRVSLIQIKSLWTAYCVSNTDKECGELK